jgi:hypothetical protein
MTGLELESTGPFQVPLRGWNDLCNLLSWMRVRIDPEFEPILTALRHSDPEYRAHIEEKRRRREHWEAART